MQSENAEDKENPGKLERKVRTCVCKHSKAHAMSKASLCSESILPKRPVGSAPYYSVYYCFVITVFKMTDPKKNPF